MITLTKDVLKRLCKNEILQKLNYFKLIKSNPSTTIFLTNFNKELITIEKQRFLIKFDNNKHFFSCFAYRFDNTEDAAECDHFEKD